MLQKGSMILGLVLLSVVGGMLGAFLYVSTNGNFLKTLLVSKQQNAQTSYVPQTTQEEKIIEVVKNSSLAVVSIIITKDVPIVEQYFTDPFQGFPSPFQFQVPQYRQLGTEKKEVGGGSGFIVSEDGFVLTNKHVVIDEKADYTVFTTDGKSYPAKVLAKDPVQDLAVLKIEQDEVVGAGGVVTKKPFPTVPLGDSNGLQIGQTVIAIGNALGEFRNTVSVGVISGLGRTITASGGSFVETIEDVIQTDAAINKGNSGGPLLNLAGEVIGVNTATVLDAQSIGFTVPVNKAKRDIEQVKSEGRIIYPYLGVRYLLITPKIQEDRNLSVDYGALIQKGSSGEKAVESGSAAQKAGLEEGDIILEVGGEKVTQDNSVSKILQKYSPEDTVSIKFLRGSKEQTISATLGERAQ